MSIVVIADMLKYQISEHKRYSTLTKQLEDMTVLDVINQHAQARACSFVLSNTMYRLTEGNAFGLNKSEVVELAKLVPELKAALISKYGYSHSRRDVFSEEQIKQLQTA